ncbi:MAG: hypothetical protein SPL28_05390 [Bacteroidales bacterium]|nr:hypothetical protein [Bacteroidales bacterium]
MASKYHIWAILLLMICATGFTVGAQSQRSIDLVNDNDRAQLEE